MEKIKGTLVRRMWGIYLTIVFQCARMVLSITRTPMRGALVALWQGGRILLIQKSYRKPWSVPGGLIKKGETYAQAGVREAFEEVGVRLRPEDLTYIETVPGKLGPNDRAHLFEVELDGPVAVTIDGREIVKAEFVIPEVAFGRLLLDDQIEGYLRAIVQERSPHNRRS